MPAAERGAVNGRDQRLGAVFDVAQSRMNGARPFKRRLARGDGLEKADVRSGDERAARADQHHSARRGILRATRDGRFDGLGNAGTERVYGRVVDGDDGDLIADFVADEFGHGSNLTVGRRMAERNEKKSNRRAAGAGQPLIASARRQH